MTKTEAVMLAGTIFALGFFFLFTLGYLPGLTPVFP